MPAVQVGIGETAERAEMLSVQFWFSTAVEVNVVRNRRRTFHLDESKFCNKGTSESLNPADAEILYKLEALEMIFSQSKDSPEEFHINYVKPLIDAELNLETALDLIVAGFIQPN